MSPNKEIPTFDGATLSPKLKARDGADPHSHALPIGKSAGAGGVAVARQYKHAAGKSSTYSPQVVDMIYHMSRDGAFSDEHTARFVAAKLAGERDSPRATPPTTWDQLVFLSANLTRLVIDPYREKCNSIVRIGDERPRPLSLDWPIVYGGIQLSRLPGSIASHLVQTAARANLAVETEAAFDTAPNMPRIVRVDATQPLPTLNGACAVEVDAPRATLLDVRRLGPVVDALRLATDRTIPVGIVAPAFNASTVVDQTVQLGVDFYVADAQWTEDARPDNVFPELRAAPAIGVLTDTVEQLRLHCREEAVQIIYRGGIRGGADAGKAICLGATAVTLGLSAVVGMGFQVTQIADEQSLLDQLANEQRESRAIETHLYNFTKSVVMEVTMLARACGKSSVTNMEPEDLRALSRDLSAVTGIPVVGKDYNFRVEETNRKSQVV